MRRRGGDGQGGCLVNNKNVGATQILGCTGVCQDTCVRICSEGIRVSPGGWMQECVFLPVREGIWKNLFWCVDTCVRASTNARIRICVYNLAHG